MRKLMRAATWIAATAFCALLTACWDGELINTGSDLAGLEFGGDPKAGVHEITRTGCGACHTIPGIAEANGLVGPPLTQMGRRTYLAGVLRNTPDNMMVWLQKPQKVVPGNAMPDMGLSEQQARNITAYLYTLK
jgi:cytochrome c1